MNNNTIGCNYYCYAIVLCDNCIESEIYPALFVCWDSRAENDKQVFNLKRYNRIKNPVITTTPEDIYELKSLYSKFRFSIRDKKGRPRKVFFRGILVAMKCNKDLSKFVWPAIYISHVNFSNEYCNEALARWQNVYLEKERLSSIYDLSDILSHEDGIEYNNDYFLEVQHAKKSIC